MISPKPHFAILDGLRGVAALAIVVFHFLEWEYPNPSRNYRLVRSQSTKPVPTRTEFPVSVVHSPLCGVRVAGRQSCSVCQFGWG